MPITNFAAAIGLTYAISDATDSNGEVVANAVYSVDAPNVLQLNAPGFVTAGGTNIPGDSFTALANGVAKLTAKGTDSAGDEVDSEVDVTVATVEAGTITVGAGTP